MRSPYELYCRKHINHPDLPMLIKAEQDGDAEAMGKYVREINRDGWREHLATVHVTDTKAFFAYLAKADGRRSFTRRMQCADPLLDESGVVRTLF